MRPGHRVVNVNNEHVNGSMASLHSPKAKKIVSIHTASQCIERSDKAYPLGRRTSVNGIAITHGKLLS